MHRFTGIFCTLALALGTLTAATAEPLPQELLIPAAKADSGLGELRHASEWRGMPWLYALPAEKIDSGLGELPQASEWRGMPWLHAMPAEKIDSGLGEIPARAARELTRAP